VDKTIGHWIRNIVPSMVFALALRKDEAI